MKTQDNTILITGGGSGNRSVRRSAISPRDQASHWLNTLEPVTSHNGIGPVVPPAAASMALARS